MEQTAVQLMSRKQRAAKLLTGDIGLTGLDALTEGEGGLEEALLAAIGRDEALLNPSELFKKSGAQSEIDNEDAAYWNVELAEPEITPTVEVDDPLIQEVIRLGGVITKIEAEPQPLAQMVFDYLDTVHIITDAQKLDELRAELLTLLSDNPARVGDWLRDNCVVFPGCETEVSACIVSLVQGTNRDPVNVIPLHAVTVSAKSSKSAAAKTRRLDLLAVPDDAPQPKRQQPERVDETAPLQLALF